MIEYVATNPGDTIERRDVLRVTFAETPQWFVPDEIASMNLAAEVTNLVAAIDAGTVGLVPVSDINVPPGAQTWTIDFMLQGQGRLTVGLAVTALDDAFRTLILSNGYIARVEKISAKQSLQGGTTRGTQSQTIADQLATTGFGRQLAALFGTVTTGLLVLGGVAAAIVYAPELKALMRRGKK